MENQRKAESAIGSTAQSGTEPVAASKDRYARPVKIY